MNKSKLIPKIIVFLALGILTISFIPSVQAGVPPFLDPTPGQYIGYYPWDGRDISASDYSYFKVGFGYTPEETQTGWWPKNPYKVRLYFDGVEIPLRRYVWYDKEGEAMGAPVHWWYFYQIFKPGYFTLEEDILVRIEVYVKKPYLGSDSNKWRWFVNLEGPAIPWEDPFYGPIGLPWTLEHYIHIIA